MKSKNEFTNLPKSIGIIMDGNGRWAKKRFMPRSLGHRSGVIALEKMLDSVFSLGIGYVTVYAFSTENQGRPKEEIDALFSMVDEFFNKKLPKLIKSQIRVKVVGDMSYFSDDMRRIIADAEAKTAHFTEHNFYIALNYGSRNEIITACNKAVESGKAVTEEEFSKLLFTGGMPDPDVLIRTGGDKRLSNFMLYQLAYTELFFVDTLWPDFGKKELYKILEEYGARARRFGKV